MPRRRFWMLGPNRGLCPIHWLLPTQDFLPAVDPPHSSHPMVHNGSPGAPHCPCCLWLCPKCGLAPLVVVLLPQATLPPYFANHCRRSFRHHPTKKASPHTVAKYHFRLYLNGIKSIPNFIQICPAVLKLNHADRQTGLTSPICMNFMHFVQRMHNKAYFSRKPVLHNGIVETSHWLQTAEWSGIQCKCSSIVQS
jgi:hypothetical protein